MNDETEETKSVPFSTWKPGDIFTIKGCAFMVLEPLPNFTMFNAVNLSNGALAHIYNIQLVFPSNLHID